MNLKPIIAITYWLDTATTDLIGSVDTIMEAREVAEKIYNVVTIEDVMKICDEYGFKKPKKLQSLPQKNKISVTPYIV